jgi:signal peptidase II
VKYILLLTLPLYALDQATKLLVLRYITADEPRIVVPEFFALVYITNTGAAFGTFKGNNLFFICLSLVALVVVTTMLLRGHERDSLRDISLSLLLAGVLGNLTDRLHHGAVIDFLVFDLHVPFASPWPAFNVADACICVAVFFFIVHTFRQSHQEKAAAANS